jgi:hypothetical protein
VARTDTWAPGLGGLGQQCPVPRAGAWREPRARPAQK